MHIKLKPFKVVVASLVFSTSFFANAGLITTFSERASFEALAESVETENFNSFTSEDTFHTDALDVGDFTLSMTGTPSTARNYIDMPPLLYSEFNVDGTTVANILTSLSASLFITFDSPIYSFAADFGGFQDGIIRTDIVVDGNVLTPNINSTFFGLISDTAFSVIEFRGRENDGFGMDNVNYSHSKVSEVPEPSTLAVFALGIMGLASRRANKKA